MKVVAGRHRRALNIPQGVWHSKEKWPAQGGFSANLPTHKDRRGERDGKNFARRVGRLSACEETARTTGEGTKGQEVYKAQKRVEKERTRTGKKNGGNERDERK